MQPHLARLLVLGSLVAALQNSEADLYTDATNELFSGANAPQLDISSVAVTNDSTSLYFSINLVGNPTAPNWGYYCIAFVTAPGGCTNGNGSGLSIALTEGINYWVTCQGWGNPQLYEYRPSTASWTNRGGGAVTYAAHSRSISLAVSYASLGLAAGASFQFDVYTSAAGDGAVDDVANLNTASSWWNVGYTNSLLEKYPLRTIAAGTMNVNVAEDTNTIIWKNPGKGWISYNWIFPGYYPASQQAMINLMYNRWDWAVIETNENEFNWSQIDTGISQAQAHGIRFAFGIMTTDVPGNATPEWVFNDGAQYYSVGGYKVPYWSTNPVFFAKLDAFLAKLGQRYNGNTNVAFVDVRDFGEWGEGHLGYIDVADNGQVIPYPTVGEIESNYFQPYVTNFANTQLVVPWGASIYNAAYAWVVQQQAGMRRDGVPNCLATNNEIGIASGHGPGVIEFCDDYDWSVTNGAWNNAVVCADILSEKASYCEISWDADFFSTFSNRMASIENQMGYHFVLQSVAIPPWLSSVTPNPITMTWSNRGVSFLYEPCAVAMALLDVGNSVVGSKCWLSGVNPTRNWAPGTIEVAGNMSFSSVPAGIYGLAVGLFSTTNQAAPNFRLGNKGQTPNGWYVITNVALWNIARPASNPTNLTIMLANGNLTLSWPADHLGWVLETQIDSGLTGLGSNWVVVDNSMTTNTMVLPVSSINAVEYFRLKY